MSEDVQSEEATAPAGGGASWMIVLLIMVLALAAGAGGTYFMMGQQSRSPVSEADEEPAEPMLPGQEFRERLVTLEPFIVNVGGEGYPRFLKLKIELEADSDEAKQELEARIPQVRDTTILLLASKRLPEVTEFEGRTLLKDDLRLRINEILGHGQVASVLFTEFVIQ